MPQITFSVPGKCKPLKRHRTTVVGGFARTYDPAENKSAKTQVGWYAKQAMGDMPLFEGPLWLSVTFSLLRPKSRIVKRPDKASEERLYRAMFPTSKPDLDNLEKLLKDALNKVVWRDDSQVCKVSKEKVYTDTDPKMDVVVRPLAMGEAGSEMVAWRKGK